MACSRRWTLCPTACFQLQPGLTWRHIIHGDELAAATNLMSSSNSICRLRFTVHGRDRFLHRAHGALPFVMWHLIWRTSARDTCTRRFWWYLFFDLLPATRDAGCNLSADLGRLAVAKGFPQRRHARETRGVALHAGAQSTSQYPVQDIQCTEGFATVARPGSSQYGNRAISLSHHVVYLGESLTSWG